MPITKKAPATGDALTLAIDIGGSHLKAGILSAAGAMVGGPVRMDTPKPATPQAVVAGLANLVPQLGRFDRVSIGFPGVVRGVSVLTAPNLGTDAWRGFKLAAEVGTKLGKPVRMLNDASIQGLGVISGHGVECVLTLGTGMGFALFEEGRIAPHLEMSQQPIKTDKTYDAYVGDAALEEVGKKHWNKRIAKIIGVLATVVNFDHLYLGGGNAKAVQTPLPENVTTVSNQAGITGGVRLWDPRMDEAFAQPHGEFP